MMTMLLLMAKVLVAIGDHDRIENLLLFFNHPNVAAAEVEAAARLPSANLL